MAKGVWGILLISFIADNANYFFIRLIYPNSFIIGNIWILLNYFIMIWTFNEILSQKKKLSIILCLVFSIGSILTFGFYYSFLEGNIFTTLWSNVSFITLSLIVYFQLLQKPGQNLFKLPVFWISTSFFVYNSLVLLQSIFRDYLIFDLQISKEAYAVINFINLIANISKNYILFYALVMIGKGFGDSLKSHMIND